MVIDKTKLYVNDMDEFLIWNMQVIYTDLSVTSQLILMAKSRSIPLVKQSKMVTSNKQSDRPLTGEISTGEYLLSRS